MTTTTHVPTLDRTVQKTNEWLGDVMEKLGDDDRQRAYVALRAVFHALRDRLQIAEAADLGAQLPILLRGVYYEGWSPSRKPLPLRTSQQFLERVAAEILDESIDPERSARAVFTVLQVRISAGEINDVLSNLPPELRELWD